MLTLRNIHLNHPPAGSPLLAGLDLEIKAGQRLLIEGPSGCGKSSLARLLAGLDPSPVAGSITLDKEEIAPAATGLRQAVSMVFQNSGQTLIMPDVRQELAFGLENRNIPPDDIDRRISAVSHRFALAPLLPRDPLTLSGGEKQKVALAAALITSPRLLILDEPEAHLDSASGQCLLELLNQIHAGSGTALLILDHPHSSYRTWADDSLTLDQGRLREVSPAAPRALTLSLPPVTTPTSPAALLSVGPMTFQPYRQSTLIFQNLEMSLATGECVHLRGNNGSGKSTLLRTLLKPPAPMRDGVQMRGQSAYLPQEARDLFLHHTVREEFEFLSRLNPAQSSDDTTSLIRDFELEHLLDRECRTLSAGEEQLVALGLVLASPSSLFFLDEPTSHLDRRQKEKAIHRIIALRAGGAAFLIASQDPEIDGLYDRTLELEHAKLRSVFS